MSCWGCRKRPVFPCWGSSHEPSDRERKDRSSVRSEAGPERPGPQGRERETMSVTAAKGFVAGGLACGIKESGAPDLAIVATEDHAPVAAAGVFTTNLAQAAPVQISRWHLGDGRAAAVVLNSGNANAATGEPGRRDAARMCALTGNGLHIKSDDVLVCSTGLIGIPLPFDALEAGIPKL